MLPPHGGIFTFQVISGTSLLTLRVARRYMSFHSLLFRASLLKTVSKFSLAEPRLLIERENKPSTNATQDFCSLQLTVQTNQIVESFYVTTYAYPTNLKPCVTTLIFENDC